MKPLTKLPCRTLPVVQLHIYMLNISNHRELAKQSCFTSDLHCIQSRYSTKLTAYNKPIVMSPFTRAVRCTSTSRSSLMWIFRLLSSSPLSSLPSALAFLITASCCSGLSLASSAGVMSAAFFSPNAAGRSLLSFGQTHGLASSAQEYSRLCCCFCHFACHVEFVCRSRCKTMMSLGRYESARR